MQRGDLKKELRCSLMRLLQHHEYDNKSTNTLNFYFKQRSPLTTTYGRKKSNIYRFAIFKEGKHSKKFSTSLLPATKENYFYTLTKNKHPLMRTFLFIFLFYYCVVSLFFPVKRWS